ncbi:MAG: uroporphyrinogen decarboxylase [Sphingobacteriales bacterium]
MKNTLFLDAAFSKPVSRPPVWFMRQAGRYMPEYMAIKEKYTFLEMCKTPEIAADVTMLPVDILDIDAAILFCDILVVGEAMGGDLSFEKGVGPIFSNPVRTAADIEKLLEPDTDEAFDYVYKAIHEVLKRLDGKIPLIGFAGAPFTVMSYLVEGGSTREFKKSKALIHNHPKLAHKLLDKIARVTVNYLNGQIKAGVQAVQLFDSWAHALSFEDFNEFAHRYNDQIIQGLNRTGVPVIYFCRGSSYFAPIMAKSKPDVISIDWNADILSLKQSLPSNIAVQGNLDPTILYANKPVIKERVEHVLNRMRNENGFIFNLGHGISPDMEVEKVKYAVDTVKNFR